MRGTAHQLHYNHARRLGCAMSHAHRARVGPMRKIVYLIDQPLDERNYDRFGIQTWLERGWTVEVWDLTPFAYKRVWENFHESKRVLKRFSGYFPVSSRCELNDRYSKLGRIGWFIDFTGDHLCSLRVRAALARRGARRVTSSTGMIPLSKDPEHHGLLSRLRNLIAKGPVRAISLLGNVIICRLAASLTRPRLAIVSGELSVPAPAHSHETLAVHSFDYDIYLKQLSSQDVVARPYAVFIDQDCCFHTDFVYEGGRVLTTPQRYFPAICAGLGAISRALHLDVRIAAHPRASYQHMEHDYFQGYVLECGRTGEMIKNSAVVVCHDSTAIHLAVLFAKPIIFVTTNDLIPAREGRSIALTAAELGKTAINLDGDLSAVDWRGETCVDREKYAEFKRKYIKMAGTPERCMWDVVIDHIERATNSASDRSPSNVIQSAAASKGYEPPARHHQ
jgi:hypothetical protein